MLNKELIIKGLNGSKYNIQLLLKRSESTLDFRVGLSDTPIERIKSLKDQIKNYESRIEEIDEQIELVTALELPVMGGKLLC